jgi:nucleoside-diphosphate-sugar epimerase
MTTLVTGSRGGFGRILLAALRTLDTEEAIGVTRGMDTPDGALACDLTDGNAVRDLLLKVRPRVVYHLAGSFTNDYETDYRINALAARHLLEAAGELASPARILLMGSAAEYGVVAPEENPIPETRVLRPVSVYGLTKSFQTHFATYFAHAHAADVVVARMFNLMAPGLSERLFVGRVQKQVERYLEGGSGSIEVGSLENSRDYVVAEEAVSQVRAIAARGSAGGVYHVASGKAFTMREILNRMLDDAGVPREAIREVSPAATGRSGYDVPLVCADITRTRALMKDHA